MRTLLSQMKANVPTDTIAIYSGPDEPPERWLFCHGQPVLRTLYSKLFEVIGVTYGISDAVKTFNLPDLRGRVVLGVDIKQTRVHNASTVR